MKPVTTIKSGLHNIIIGNEACKVLDDHLSQETMNPFILVDDQTKVHCLPYLMNCSEKIIWDNIIQIPEGEKYKNLQQCEIIWNRMFQNKADRNALLINLGGGMISDLGGFAASTFKRGIRYFNIPTSLTGQVDASIGGKVGINHGEIKNQIGLFSFPRLIVIDPVFLKTLPEREIRSGFTEIIKHALIADRKLWEKILHSSMQELLNFPSDKNAWIQLITESVRIKNNIVSSDPYEKNLRKYLNFGHTVGHAIEAHALHTEHDIHTHGEAIAAGMICEMYISSKVTGFSFSDVETVSNHIIRYTGHHLISRSSFNDLVSLMEHDKKNISGKIMFTLLSEIGKPVINKSCEQQIIFESFEYLNSLT